MNLDKKNIKSISYDYEKKQMIINLKNKILIDNFMRDELIYNCNEKTFINSVSKFLEE